MDSKNSKTSNPHRLLLNLSDKKDLKRSDKCVALSTLSIYYTWKKIKKSYELRRGIKNLSYLTDNILNQIFKIILNIS